MIKNKKELKMTDMKTQKQNASTTSSSTASTKVAVFSKLRKKFPNLMFFVSKECDFNVVLYDTMKRENNLSSSICNYTRVNLENLDAKGLPLAQVLQENFYGLSEPIKVGEGMYKTSMHALPERTLTIKLKKGKCNLFGEVGNSKNAMLICVHLFVDFSFGIPQLNHLTIIGIDDKTRKIVEEPVPVTSDMLKKFDISQIVKTYLSSS